MAEESYAFRLRYTRSPRDTVNCKETELRLPAIEPDHEIILKARERDQTIESAGSLELQGAGWETSAEAEHQGGFYGDILTRVYARLRLGADFGARAAKSWFTEAGLEAFSKQTGKPVLNDVHGLMVYDRASIPTVLFASMKAKGVVGIPRERFLSVFSSTLARPRKISEQERVALELFNASFFQKSVDGRFMLLMMGVEALIKQESQSDKVKTLVRGFLESVAAATDLGKKESDDLKSRLGSLQKESIRQAGCRLVGSKLSEKKYNEITAQGFFETCYNIRSRLAHGEIPLPTTGEVNGVVAQLEVMLSDLLSTDLLDVGPQP